MYLAKGHKGTGNQRQGIRVRVLNYVGIKGKCNKGKCNKGKCNKGKQG